jgi:hypothetical protein
MSEDSLTVINLQYEMPEQNIQRILIREELHEMTSSALKTIDCCSLYSCAKLSTAAMLVLLSGTARTGIIAPDFFTGLCHRFLSFFLSPLFPPGNACLID